MRSITLFFFAIVSFLRISAQVVVVYGDTRTNHDIHQKIVDNIITLKPVAVFHSGDLVDNGMVRSNWTRYNDIAGQLISTTNYYPCLGNHELNSRHFYTNFELPNNEKWFSVDYIGVHWIVLNSSEYIKPGNEQYTWLANDLEKAKDSSLFIVAVFHNPPFSTGYHGNDVRLQKTLVPLLSKYQVDIVFNGHDHCYEKSKFEGTYYIVTGGGGAPLYDQSSQSEYSLVYKKAHHICKVYRKNGELNIEVLDIDMNPIDSISIPRKVR